MVETHNTTTTTNDANDITSSDTLLTEVHHIDETNADDTDDPYDSIFKECFVLDGYPNFWKSVKKFLNKTNKDAIGNLRYTFKHPNAPTNIPESSHSLRWDDVQTLCMEQPLDSKVMDYCLFMIRDELGDTCPPIFTTWDINFPNLKSMPDEYYDKDEVKILVMHNCQLNPEFDQSSNVSGTRHYVVVLLFPPRKIEKKKKAKKRKTTKPLEETMVCKYICFDPGIGKNYGLTISADFKQILEDSTVFGGYKYTLKQMSLNDKDKNGKGHWTLQYNTPNYTDFNCGIIALYNVEQIAIKVHQSKLKYEISKNETDLVKNTNFEKKLLPMSRTTVF